MKFNTNLREILTEYVETLRDFYNNPRNYTKDEVIAILKKTSSQIKKSTGLNVYFQATQSGYFDAYSISGVGIGGHGATTLTNYPDSTIRQFSNRSLGIEEFTDLEIDLVKLKFKGKLADTLEFLISIDLVHFHRNANITNDEIVAVLAHEFGHVVSKFINLGDYIMMNNYIANAIEIFQGKQANTKSVKVYTEAWIKANLDEDDINQFVYGQASEKEATRVALMLARKLPRGHITGSTFASNVREEQFADLFASRLGYAKALATGFHKIEALFGNTKDTKVNSHIVDFIGFLYFLPFKTVFLLPAALLSLTRSLPDYSDFSRRYDNLIERLSKIKRDLIAQSKVETDKAIRNKHLEEIKSVEYCISQMLEEGKTYFDTVTTFFNPTWRKHEQQYKKESILETLVNNDIFTKGFRIS